MSEVNSLKPLSGKDFSGILLNVLVFCGLWVIFNLIRYEMPGMIVIFADSPGR